MEERLTPGLTVFEAMSAHRWGYTGGRLARIMADAIRSSLTEDAVDAVLQEFRSTLAMPTDPSESVQRSGPDASRGVQYS